MKSHRIVSAVFVVVMLAFSALSVTACSSTDSSAGGSSGSSSGY